VKIRDLARNLPLFARRPLSRALALAPPEIRYGRPFTRVRRLLRETETWNTAEIEAYQACELRRVVRHAFENVPFYRRMFERRGLKPTDIESATDLARLPLIDRETIRENIGDLLARDVPPSRIYRDTTGGTTGLPMYIYGEQGAGPAREWAFVWRGWNWAGHRFGERRAVIRGTRYPPGRTPYSPPWGFDPVHNEFLVSALDLTPGNLPGIVRQMTDLAVVCVQAYPSAMHMLAEWLRVRGQGIPSLRLGLTGSETLLPRQRDQTEEQLGLRIYDHYGNSERSALIMQCEQRTYHIIPEYGIIELLDSEGNAVREEGQIGEIVATGFTNRVMPLIRHRTGDFAIHTLRPCPCGRSFPAVERILGRRQEFFVGTRGELLTSLWSDEAIWEVREKIRAYQYVQDVPGRVTLNVESGEPLSGSEVATVHRRFLEVYPTLAMELRYVEGIPRTERGKFRYLIQNLPMAGAEPAEESR